MSPSQPDKPKRKSDSGLARKIDAAVIRSMEKRKEQPKRKDPIRRIVGAAMLGLWMMFMAAEFFHLLPHVENDFEHMMVKWMPLAVGLALLAPDALEKVTGFIGRIRGLRVSLPPKDDPPSE